MVEAELPAIREAGALDASSAALPARMAAWRVRVAAGDARAPRQHELAMSELPCSTAKIGNPNGHARALEGRPLHREITAAWQRRSA